MLFFLNKKEAAPKNRLSTERKRRCASRLLAALPPPQAKTSQETNCAALYAAQPLKKKSEGVNETETALVGLGFRFFAILGLRLLIDVAHTDIETRAVA